MSKDDSNVVLGTKQSTLKNPTGLARLAPALKYSLQGLCTAAKNESAFRQELVIFAIGTVLACIFPITVYEKISLVLVLLWVLIVELMNSAIEAVVDRISLEKHELSKNAKDFGSAAVLLSIVLASSVWVVVLLKNFL